MPERRRTTVKQTGEGWTAHGTPELVRGRFLRRERDIEIHPPSSLEEMAKRGPQQQEAQRQIAQWNALDGILDTIKGYSSLSNGAALGSILTVAKSVKGQVREEDLVILNPITGTYGPVAIAVAFYVAERRTAGETVSYENLGEIVAMTFKISEARAQRERELLTESEQGQ